MQEETHGSHPSEEYKPEFENTQMQGKPSTHEYQQQAGQGGVFFFCFFYFLFFAIVCVVCAFVCVLCSVCCVCVCVGLICMYGCMLFLGVKFLDTTIQPE